MNKQFSIYFILGDLVGMCVGFVIDIDLPEQSVDGVDRRQVPEQGVYVVERTQAPGNNFCNFL